MNKIIKSIIPILLFSNQVWAADSGSFMQSSGKFYVVIAVIVAMFIGLVIFLFSLDRKISKLESQIKS